LSTRLDYVLVLNGGGLAVLGKYVALMALVSVIPVFATFILDSLLPSLTNTLALGDLDYAKRLVETYLRIMLPCGLGAACFLLLFAGPVTYVLGHHYESLARLIILAVPFAAMKVLSWFAGIMLSAIGQPHRNAVAQVLQAALMCGAFWVFWPRYGLLGAVLAWGMPEVCYQCLGLYFLLRKMPFSFSLFKTYGPFLLVTFLTAGVAEWFGGKVVLSAGLWVAAMLLFLLLSRYTVAELGRLRRVIWKGSVSLG
jgi:O-antigen/teichoic acid export membrane protein